MRESTAFEGGALLLESKNSAGEMGHRIAKHVYNSGNIWEKSIYYVLDAQGNTMSVYEHANDDVNHVITFAQTEKHIYGSARLGTNTEKTPLFGSQNNTYSIANVRHRMGERTYELSNHLGNVLSVISDKVIPHNNGGTPDYWLADIRQSTDYSPFGVQLKGRDLKLSGNNIPYDYGFNGMRKDDEIKSEGNSYDFGNRMYDSRLGRWLSIDAYSKKYPYMSPYSYVGNSPLTRTDGNGDTIIILIWRTDFEANSYGHSAIAVQNYKNVTKSFTFRGMTLTYTDRVPDGTYTYYDLWPSGRVGNDKESNSNPVPASYHEKKSSIQTGKVFTKEQLLNSDPSEGENEKKANGVIVLYTNRKMDGTVKAALQKHRDKFPDYVGASNNCSDYVRTAIEFLFREDITEDYFGKEQFYGNKFTTPNELFKDTKKVVEETKKGKVLRENGSFDKPFISDKQSGGYGESRPSKNAKR